MPKPVYQGDRNFKEIKNQLLKKMKNKQDEKIIQEIYVDQYRMISVQLGSQDLKGAISSRGLLGLDAETAPGEPNELMYLKQANHYIKKSQYEQALKYIEKSLQYNPQSERSLSTAAKCHLKLGNWSLAIEAADMVLMQNRRSTKALLAKAEALFNICQFEHAMVFFYRGQVIVPESEEFRLGIQKCRKEL